VGVARRYPLVSTPQDDNTAARLRKLADEATATGHACGPLDDIGHWGSFGRAEAYRHAADVITGGAL